MYSVERQAPTHEIPSIEGFEFYAEATSNPQRLIYASIDAEYFLKLYPDDSVQTGGIQEQLYAQGWPVVPIVERGNIRDSNGVVKPYIIERSAGKTFQNEIECGSIPDNVSVDQYTSAVNNWLKIQLSHSLPYTDNGISQFENRIHLDELCNDVAEKTSDVTAQVFREKAQNIWQLIRPRLVASPFAINQGDMEGRNISKDGTVIDLEYAFSGPVAYDAVSSLFHTFMFPPENELIEAQRNHSFSHAQIISGLAKYDKTMLEAGSLPLSEQLDEMLLAQLFWSAGGESERPHLQAWRWRLLWNAMAAYTPGQQGNVTNVLLNPTSTLLKEKQKITEEFHRAVKSSFGDNLAAAFVVGGLARNCWRGPTSDIDVFVAVHNADPSQEANFVERYQDFHTHNFYTPDKQYPGEVMSLERLRSALQITAEREPIAVIPQAEDVVYDGIVWANMLSREKIAPVGNLALLACLTTRSMLIKQTWHTALNFNEDHSENLSHLKRYATQYEGDLHE